MKKECFQFETDKEFNKLHEILDEFEKITKVKVSNIDYDKKIIEISHNTESTLSRNFIEKLGGKSIQNIEFTTPLKDKKLKIDDKTFINTSIITGGFLCVCTALGVTIENMGIGIGFSLITLNLILITATQSVHSNKKSFSPMFYNIVLLVYCLIFLGVFISIYRKTDIHYFEWGKMIDLALTSLCSGITLLQIKKLRKSSVNITFLKSFNWCALILTLFAMVSIPFAYYFSSEQIIFYACIAGFFFISIILKTLLYTHAT